ncbi:MAG: hypothetical protein JWO09_656 [Bacteroidetes bacterium]|nr:hypothetical protein [Bacteroidota bacterium]
MTENETPKETKIKNARLLTTILLIIPTLLLILIPVNAFFWPLFCFTLFPFSIIILTVHYFIGQSRRKNNLKINEFDNVKIYLGSAGLIAGITLWGILYVVTH